MATTRDNIDPGNPYNIYNMGIIELIIQMHKLSKQIAKKLSSLYFIVNELKIHYKTVKKNEVVWQTVSLQRRKKYEN